MMYEFESAGLLFYDYRTHMWEWDVKFYLVNDMWCQDREGLCPVGELTDLQRKTIQELAPLIQEREAWNAAYLVCKACRKRSCICKNCDKHCFCGSCTGKQKVCPHGGVCDA